MSDEEALSRWKVCELHMQRLCCLPYRVHAQDLHRHVVTQTAQAFVSSFLTRCVRVNLEHQQRDPSSTPSLDVDSILPRYKYSSVRLILLDLEDTLWVRVHPRHAFEPPAEAVAILRKLGDDPRNRVWLLSGLPRGALDKVARVVPSIGLVWVVFIRLQLGYNID